MRTGDEPRGVTFFIQGLRHLQAELITFLFHFILETSFKQSLIKFATQR